MKTIKLLQSYLRGIRLQAVALAIIMTWSVFCTVYMWGKIQNIYTDLNVIKNSNYKNAYYLALFSTKEDILLGQDEVYAAETECILEAEEIVDSVLSIRTANPVSYNNKGISISIIEPEMVEFFPEIKNMGIDFSQHPDGCILAGKQFEDLSAGEGIDLKISGKSVSLEVAGKIKEPYRRLSLSTASTIPQAETLFSDGEIIVMQRTESTQKRVEALAARVNIDTNLIVLFQDGTSTDEREDLLSNLAAEYVCVPLEELVARSEVEIGRALKKEMPLPAFLVIASVVAHLSVAILTFKKKEREMAITYLCGGSRRKCAGLVLAVIQLYSFIPIMINIILIWIWPKLNLTKTWAYSVLPEASTEIIRIRARIATLYGIVEIPRTWPIIVGLYYLVTTIITLSITILTIRKKSPVTYLRGVSQ